MISSTANPRIKNLKLLQKPRERKKQNLFVVEGLKELEKAIPNGYEVRSLFYSPEMIEVDKLDTFKGHETQLVEISKKVFNEVAYRGESGGVIACLEPKKHTLDQIRLGELPLVLVLESVEKPGNLGALLRTADAAGVDAVVLCDPQTDLYNPNVIRSSIGCLFSVPLAVTDSASAITWLKEKKLSLYCAALTASKPYSEVDFTFPSAIVMGTEATGLTTQWLSQSDQNVIIPMYGHADSMNVSTSAAVILFEAVRQRKLS